MASLLDSANCQYTASQLFRYALVGIISNVGGYVVYLMITSLGATPKVTMSLLYCVGTLIGYFGNRGLTFSYKGPVVGSGIRYLLVYSAGYLMNLGILMVFVDAFRFAHQIVQAVAILVVAAFLFIALKLFVFRDLVPEQSSGNL